MKASAGQAQASLPRPHRLLPAWSAGTYPGKPGSGCHNRQPQKQAHVMRLVRTTTCQRHVMANIIIKCLRICIFQGEHLPLLCTCYFGLPRQSNSPDPPRPARDTLALGCGTSKSRMRLLSATHRNLRLVHFQSSLQASPEMNRLWEAYHL